MNAPAAPLEQCILDEGMEDLIPLPEIVQTVGMRGLSKSPLLVSEVAAAIGALVRQGRIQVWAGQWPAEPEFVARPLAESLVEDLGQYQFNSPSDLSRRVYYVNVDNLYVKDGA
ncbi:hypothetical protein BJ978_002480 [Agromyces terreus]|uniref:Uncharacterized protein n=1 Tax=Agromyces terreus TaxID=424795 RepID=A0A9X2H974_9MICO|nr:hypothetical protein [Agromyces terreus]MCP2371804.1 hypothetical protein [Agromyces terreus]